MQGSARELGAPDAREKVTSNRLRCTRRNSVNMLFGMETNAKSTHASYSRKLKTSRLRCRKRESEIGGKDGNFTEFSRSKESIEIVNPHTI